MTENTPACVCCGDHRYGPPTPAGPPGFGVAPCLGCGAWRTFPDVAEADIGQWYPASYYGEQNQRFVRGLEDVSRLLREGRAREIARRVGHPGTVLDVGCGRGITLAALRDRGWRTFGIELSADAAHHATAVLGLDVGTDLFDARYPTGGFDAVVFWHSLEHIRRADLAIARAAELLRPGGVLAVAVPNSESLQARLFGGHWFHLDVPRHYHHFGERSLRRLLDRSGFDVDDVGHWNGEQNPYGVLQSALNAAGLPENILYSVLKTPSARMHSLQQHPFAVAASMLAAPVLTIAGTALAVTEAAAGRGGTIEVWARRR
jgi:2-polyprenyl-3-methyl-5-hydroxy-6-metoxy-1,4-benzoquinol methylase